MKKRYDCEAYFSEIGMEKTISLKEGDQVNGITIPYDGDYTFSIKAQGFVKHPSGETKYISLNISEVIEEKDLTIVRK